MGQIVKRKKKGRPSKADLARRSGGGLASSESEPRRSLRRRNARYNVDYDDFLEEDDDEDEEDDERGREKKLKLVVKLNQGRDGENLSPVAAGLSRSGARGAHASEYGSSASEGEDEPERKPLKKRRIGGGEDDDEDEDYDDQIRGDGDENEDDDIDEERGRKVGSKGSDSVPGTPSDRSSGLPLPDKKTLELILDKLQKKDTYGVYAEPVDPEELPDYFDVIEHPMDFATVRNKLASGSYSTLEQFENDVFLICSNAMQYNSPETIYHKQARSIQELAKKKFERVRIEVERSEKELKEQNAKSNSLFKKQPAKKPFFRTLQEPIESDFSSGATLAAAGDVQNSANPIQGANFEVPNNIDGQVEGCFSLFDSSNPDKAEELFSGKGLLGKLGRKTSVFDDNRRATYNISNSPAPRSESIFSTFEDEIRQLVAVGLHAEYSYARSLARFSATLGPVAWKVASQRIEQAIPVGCKFGRGWVGEYEPLPTPVLMFENNQKEPSLNSNLHSTSELRKDGKSSDTLLAKKEHHSLSGPSTEVNGLARGSTLDKPSFFRSATPSPGLSPRQNLPTKNRPEGEKVKKQVELNSFPSPRQSKVDLGVEKQLPANPNMTASRSRDMASVNLNLVQSAPFKLPSVNGVVTGGLPNGILPSNCLNSPRAALSSSSLPSQTVPVATSHGQDLGPGKPVHLMRMMSERAPKQESSSNQSSSDSPRALSSAPSAMRDDLNNAAAVASRAWMSIGAAGGFKQVRDNPSPKSQISADSLYNPAREFQPQMTRAWGEFRAGSNQLQSEKNAFPMQAFVPQTTLVPNEQQLHNRSMIYPQLVHADMSKFQLHSTWRALSPHNQPRKKQEMLPPDLNIGFQSPGSPVKQSSSALVDSQQPDLALQL